MFEDNSTMAPVYCELCGRNVAGKTIYWVGGFSLCYFCYKKEGEE